MPPIVVLLPGAGAEGGNFFLFTSFFSNSAAERTILQQRIRWDRLHQTSFCLAQWLVLLLSNRKFVFFCFWKVHKRHNTRSSLRHWQPYVVDSRDLDRWKAHPFGSLLPEIKRVPIYKCIFYSMFRAFSPLAFMTLKFCTLHGRRWRCQRWLDCRRRCRWRYRDDGGVPVTKCRHWRLSPWWQHTGGQPDDLVQYVTKEKNRQYEYRHKTTGKQCSFYDVHTVVD